jgi:hypothetical protein
LAILIHLPMHTMYMSHEEQEMALKVALSL